MTGEVFFCDGVEGDVLDLGGEGDRGDALRFRPDVAADETSAAPLSLSLSTFLGVDRFSTIFPTLILPFDAPNLVKWVLRIDAGDFFFPGLVYCALVLAILTTSEKFVDRKSRYNVSLTTLRNYTERRDRIAL